MTYTKVVILRMIASACIAVVVGLFMAKVLEVPLPWAFGIGILASGASSLLYSNVSRRSQS